MGIRFYLRAIETEANQRQFLRYVRYINGKPFSRGLGYQDLPWVMGQDQTTANRQ
jgi:hypothetical protein